MPSKKLSVLWLPLGAAGALGVFSLLMLVLAAVPKLAELNELQQLAYLYHDHIRAPLMRFVFGRDAQLPWSSGVIDVLFFWISLFVAINVFVYKNEDHLLWGHIRKNYCSLTADGFSKFLCTFWKFVVALLSIPIACLSMAIASLRADDNTLFTSCYITLNPLEIVRYLRFLSIALAATITVVAFFSSVAKLQL